MTVSDSLFFKPGKSLIVLSSIKSLEHFSWPLKPFPVLLCSECDLYFTQMSCVQKSCSVVNKRFVLVSSGILRKTGLKIVVMG